MRRACAATISGLSARHGARDDDDVGVAEILGRVPLGDAGAERAQPLRDARELEVRAADRVAEIQQHLGDAGHAGAADADEVDVADAAHARRHARASASSTQAARDLARRVELRLRARGLGHREQGASKSPRQLASARASAAGVELPLRDRRARRRRAAKWRAFSV